LALWYTKMHYEQTEVQSRASRPRARRGSAKKKPAPGGRRKRR
jgi:hypothetical protein